MPQDLTEKSISITFPAMRNLNAVMAFSLRTGGSSPSPFASLNFSLREGDNQSNVNRNLEILSSHLEIADDEIIFCNQVHGDEVRIIESVPRAEFEADAMIATAPGLFPAIRTADCLPILLIDPKQRLSAAIHAGWKGTVLRITKKVVRTMQHELGTDPSNLLAALGPAIGPCCYEVDETVLEPFRRCLPGADRFITSLAQLKLSGNPAWMGKDGKPLKTGKSDSSSLRIDLAATNSSELAAIGVPPRNIHVTNSCTACHEELFFSHRRDSGNTGRHVALAGFRRNTTCCGSNRKQDEIS